MITSVYNRQLRKEDESLSEDVVVIEYGFWMFVHILARSTL
jgi:hypothetical protein